MHARMEEAHEERLAIWLEMVDDWAEAMAATWLFSVETWACSVEMDAAAVDICAVSVLTAAVVGASIEVVTITPAFEATSPDSVCRSPAVVVWLLLRLAMLDRAAAISSLRPVTRASVAVLALWIKFSVRMSLINKKRRKKNKERERKKERKKMGEQRNSRQAKPGGSRWRCTLTPGRMHFRLRQPFRKQDLVQDKAWTKKATLSNASRNQREKRHLRC